MYHHNISIHKNIEKLLDLIHDDLWLGHKLYKLSNLGRLGNLIGMQHRVDLHRHRRIVRHIHIGLWLCCRCGGWWLISKLGTDRRLSKFSSGICMVGKLDWQDLHRIWQHTHIDLLTRQLF